MVSFIVRNSRLLCFQNHSDIPNVPEHSQVDSSLKYIRSRSRLMGTGAGVGFEQLATEEYVLSSELEKMLKYTIKQYLQPCYPSLFYGGFSSSPMRGLASRL